MSCKRLFLPILALVFFSAVLSAAPDIEVGKNLFKNNCAACHNKSMKDDMTGPALSGSTLPVETGLTLLNFLFGCDFLSSDGRCTNGVYGTYYEISNRNIFNCRNNRRV